MIDKGWLVQLREANVAFSFTGRRHKLIFQPRGRAPPEGHQINVRGHHMMDGEETKQTLIQKTCFCFYCEIVDFNPLSL